jgi:glyoxylase-like metal-dependent hydrolase (beta-lactamase superfamily II)
VTRIELATGPVPVFAVQVGTPSLGDHSYIVAVGDRAVVVDPQRDIDRFEKILADLGVTLVAVVETHIHNDYVSGGPLLARRHDAAYVLPATSGGRMEHVAVADGDHVAVGDPWRLRAVHTPGHTPHHMSYVLTGPDGDVAVFSGGSMLVGAVGRSDLISAGMTVPLARLQYESVNYLARSLADPTVVAPTHGTGSFCSASDVLATTSTIGEERTRNPALLAADEDSFVAEQIAGYRLFPAYYAHMGPANLEGVAAVPTDPLPDLDGATLADPESAFWIVDIRPAGSSPQGTFPGRSTSRSPTTPPPTPGGCSTGTIPSCCSPTTPPGSTRSGCSWPGSGSTASSEPFATEWGPGATGPHGATGSPTSPPCRPPHPPPCSTPGIPGR